ncbi:MAG: hypothetical protein WB500_13150 [Rhodoplanes sp.]
MINLAEFGTDASKSFATEFRPAAKYIPAMDCLIYLREDVSYRAVRLDPYRTVLLHPQEDRPVGVKLKGMRFVTEKARAVLRSVGLDLKGLKLITLWEMALTENGEEVVAAAETERKQQYAARAKQLIETSDEVVNSEELPMAA